MIKIKMKLFFLKTFFLIYFCLFSLSYATDISINKDLIVIGKDNAPVKIKVFSSLTCPHCASFHINVVPKIKEKYIDTNIIKFVFRDFPLDKQALFASVLAKCAPKKKYFDFVKLILTTQEKWISNDESFMDKLKNIGKLAGLNESKIDNCFKDEQIVDEIINIRSTGEKKYNITSTPSFIINEKKYQAMSYQNFEKIIENLIN